MDDDDKATDLLQVQSDGRASQDVTDPKGVIPYPVSVPMHEIKSPAGVSGAQVLPEDQVSVLSPGDAGD